MGSEEHAFRGGDALLPEYSLSARGGALLCGGARLGDSNRPNWRELIDFSVEEVQSSLRAIGLPDDDRLAMPIIAVVDGLSLQHPIHQSVERTASMVEYLRAVRRLDQSETFGNSEQERT
ncbi:hypothetical protein ACQPZ2_29695 [Nocardia pseudovaccinii]|uniref:hypothetical protein n=1 Tax=Nocardia pseudovaccinii TaxID=189540 RepID=UPI003D900206